MPEGIGYGKGDRVAALFAYRLARRRGEMQDDDPELSSYGQSLGVAGMAQPQAASPAPTAPQEVATVGSATPMQTQKDTGIPALDALSNMPRVRSRGLVHDRRLGRVVPKGT